MAERVQSGPQQSRARRCSGAAQRTLDGEDRSERITGGRKGSLIPAYSPTKIPEFPTIVTNAGGPGVLATDALIPNGGELASLSEDSLRALNAFLPSHWSHANPIDILGDAGAEHYGKAVEIAIADPGSDGLLVILAPQGMTDPAEVARRLAPYAQGRGKPVLASWMGGPAVAEGEAILNAAGIPTFAYP